MRRSRARHVHIVALVMLLFLPAQIVAAAPTRDPDAEARALVVSAKSAFDAGRFGEAAELLERAYVVRPSATLLYNLGRAYQQAGEKTRAVDAYNRYLATEKSPPDEGAIRRTVQQLEDELARERALAERLERANREAEEQRAAQAAREQVQVRTRRDPSAIPWVVAGVGVSGLAAAGVFGGLASHDHDGAVSAATVTDAQSKQSSAEGFATVANVALVAGGVLTLTGVLWGLLDLRASSHGKTRTALRIGPGTIGLAGEL